MPRDISIRPTDPGLDLAARVQIENARRGGALEQLLGGASLIPALRRRQQQIQQLQQQQLAQNAGLSNLAQTGQISPGLQFKSAEEAAAVRKSLTPEVNPENAILEPEVRSAWSKRLGIPEGALLTVGHLKNAIEIKKAEISASRPNPMAEFFSGLSTVDGIQEEKPKTSLSQSSRKDRIAELRRKLGQ